MPEKTKGASDMKRQLLAICLMIALAVGLLPGLAGPAEATGEAPRITAQPESVTVPAGTQVSFSVAAEGSGLSYRWQKSRDGGASWGDCVSAGAKEAVFSANEAFHGWMYRCVVSDSSVSVTSEAAKLTIDNRPMLTAQPVSVLTAAGLPVAFTVAAAGSGLSYQWQKSRDGGATWGDCASANAGRAVFSFQAEVLYNGWMYRCRVSNPYGSVTSEAVTLTVGGWPGIAAQPQDVTAHAGTPVSFSVAAVGSGLHFQWQKSRDGGSVWGDCSSAGARQATFSFSASETFHGWMYRCVVSNDAGSAVSEPARLTIDFRPRITAQPQDVSAVRGAGASFSVSAEGGNLQYQWQKSTNGGATWGNCSSVGADSPVFSFQAAMLFDGWMYRCVVSNAHGSVVSQPAALTVTDPPCSATPATASLGVCIGGVRLPKVYGASASVTAEKALARDEDLARVWAGTTWRTFLTPENRWRCTLTVQGRSFTYEDGVGEARYDGTHWYFPCRALALDFGYSEYLDSVEHLATYTVLPNTASIPGGRSVPVLMYHAVGDTPYSGAIPELFVTPANLEAQLKYIKNNGFSAIWFEDLPNLAGYQKPVILTFDDGYRDNYTILFPLLKKYQVKATIFIFPNNIGKNKNFLTWGMVREMSDSGLVSFQSHTMTHPNLDQQTEAQQRWELAESQRIITAKTGKQCTVLCFPSGRYNSTTLRLAKQYYRFALRMNGNLYVTGTNRYLIPRYYVSRTTSLGSFAAMITH